MLAGEAGAHDTLLGVADHPVRLPADRRESPGGLFDATEIDEILTLRVMTMTEQEKAEARATDPRAAAIIDRCDATDAGGAAAACTASCAIRTGRPDGRRRPWWDPAADARVAAGDRHGPDRAGCGSAGAAWCGCTRSRRADAQDLFFAGQLARVTAVLTDVDGAIHVALVLVDDPAADLHEWYGRYLYFAPDELEPFRPARHVQPRGEPIMRSSGQVHHAGCRRHRQWPLLVIGVQSIPDIQRYLKIRPM